MISTLQLVSKLEKNTKLSKNTSFIPHKKRDYLRKFLPNNPTTSNIQSYLFFGSCKLEDPLGKQLEIFEELTGGEEEGEPIPTDLIVENRNDRGDRERIEGAFPIRETNGIPR